MKVTLLFTACGHVAAITKVCTSKCLTYEPLCLLKSTTKYEKFVTYASYICTILYVLRLLNVKGFDELSIHMHRSQLRKNIVLYIDIMSVNIVALK